MKRFITGGCLDSAVLECDIEVMDMNSVLVTDAVTLFWQEFPVIIKADARKPQVQSLSVRLIEGPSKVRLGVPFHFLVPNIFLFY